MSTNSPKKRRHTHLLGKSAVIGWVLAIVISFVLVVAYARLVLPGGQMAAVITAALVDLTNKDRKEGDLATLTVNPKLVAAAQAKADDMAQKGYFAHNSPDGKTSWHWFREAGYAFSHAGENLAVNFSDSADVERAWMDSPTHRANILNGNFTEIGIATAVGEYQGKQTIFVVQMFGTPAQGSQQALVTEQIPETPTEPAIAAAEPGVIVLGTESAFQEGEAAAVQAEGAETAAAPAPVAAAESQPALSAVITESVPAPEVLASSPTTLLRVLYLLAAIALLIILGLVTRLELKRHHGRHVVYACFLIVLMSGLFVAADRLIFPTPVVGQELAP